MKPAFQRNKVANPLRVLENQRKRVANPLVPEKAPADALQPAKGEQKVITQQDKDVNVLVENQNLSNNVDRQPLTQEAEPTNVIQQQQGYAPKNVEIDTSIMNQKLEEAKVAEAEVEKVVPRGVNNTEPITQDVETTRMESQMAQPEVEAQLGDVAPIVDEYAPTIMGITNRVANILPIGAFITGNPVAAGALLGGAVLAPIAVAGAIQVARKIEEAIEQGKGEVKMVQKEYKNVFKKVKA